MTLVVRDCQFNCLIKAGGCQLLPVPGTTDWTSIYGTPKLGTGKAGVNTQPLSWCVHHLGHETGVSWQLRGDKCSDSGFSGGVRRWRRLACRNSASLRVEVPAEPPSGEVSPAQRRGSRDALGEAWGAKSEEGRMPEKDEKVAQVWIKNGCWNNTRGNKNGVGARKEKGRIKTSQIKCSGWEGEM